MAPRRSGRPADSSTLTPMSDDSVDENTLQGPNSIAAQTIQLLQTQVQALQAQLQAATPLAQASGTALGTDHTDKEQERIRKLAKERLSTKPIQLLGRENYMKWRESMLSDAYMIEATHILEGNQQSPPSEDKIDIARWSKQNEVLYTRLLQSMSPQIKSTINWNDLTSAAALWSQINTVYGISSAEERLMTVKALMDLYPQGDYVSMLLDFQRITAQLRKMNVSFEDFCHDYLVCLLGQWQQQFVRTKLDEFFASGRGPIQNMDVKTLINQLIARASSTQKKQYVQQQPQEFKLEDKYRISPEKAENGKKDKESKPDSKSDTPKKKLCPECKRGYHDKSDCWKLHPEKAPEGHHLRRHLDTAKNSPQDESTGKELVVRNQANAVRLLPTNPEWLLDTAASWHMTSRRDIFIQLDDTTSQFEDAGGRIHTVKGIGTAQVSIDDLTFHVPDVRYVPTITTDLLSFSDIDSQGFQISLSETSPRYFSLMSPDGVRFEAHPHDNRTYYLTKPGVRSTKPTGHKHITAKATTRKASKFDLITVKPDPTALTMTEWHQRLCHLNWRDILRLAKTSQIKIKGPKTLPFCDICRQAKQTRRVNKNTAYRATKFLARVHIDIAGGGAALGCDDDHAPPGTKGVRYFMLITDDATRYRWIYFLRNRSEAVPCFAQWIQHLKNQNFNAPAFVRSDREFVTENVRQLCLTHGIEWEPTPSDSPWQDGVSERSNRLVYERARAMLFDAQLPKFLWKEALEAAVYLINRLPTRIPLYNDPTPGGTTANPDIQPSPYITPYTAWINGPLDISYVRKFGSIAWIHLHGSEKPTGKIDARAKKVHLVGYVSPTIVKVWDPEKNTVRTVNDAVINESFSTLTLSLKEETTKSDLPPATVIQPEIDDTPEPLTDQDLPVRPAKAFASVQIAAYDADLSAPKSYKEATQGPESAQWRAAMQAEVDLLHQKNCWDLVRSSDMPPGIRAIPGQWVYKKKRKDEDGPVRYKARWVIRGNQLSDSYFEQDRDSYAPVVSATTSRILFAAAAHYGWTILQADAVLAFLNGKLKDTVYMKQPHGFVQGQHGTLVCKLKQSLYGLTPSARIWYDTLTSYLNEVGFRVSPYDPGLFISTKRPHLYLTTHVDDFKIVGDEDDARTVLDALKAKFEINDLGQIRHYLGTSVEMSERGIKISQSSYIEDLLDSFSMSDAHATKSPLNPGIMIDDQPDPNIPITEYQRGTGSLQYLATKTRPDICRAACLLAEHNAKPTKQCWDALMHVLRYLKGTKDLGLTYDRATKNIPLPTPTAYTDSDWGGPHTDSRRSVSGFIFMLAGSPISWNSKKQTCVATSSNEAEYIAASEASREAWWISRIMEDMQLLPSPAPPLSLHMDNKGAIDLTTALNGTKRSKHIDIRFHYTRDAVQQGIISVRQIPTKEMKADGMTKPLGRDTHIEFLQQIGLRRPH